MEHQEPAVHHQTQKIWYTCKINTITGNYGGGRWFRQTEVQWDTFCIKKYLVIIITLYNKWLAE